MVSQQQQQSQIAKFPRILVVTRRTLRKNKYVDFVGEYHLSLLVQNRAVPLLIPRVPPTNAILEAYQPFDGLLLVEGEDIGPEFKPVDQNLSNDSLASIAAAHPGDSRPDHEKDSIEFALVRIALAQRIPILAICRGSQIINVAAGGDLIPDIDFVLHPTSVSHIDYSNYDDHRHPIRIVPSTPLHHWFDCAHSIYVNSYHHQAINRLAPRFVPMAHAPDGLIEAYYDPRWHDPERGKFIVGLQFHPERMQDTKASLADNPPVFDYPGCPRPYEQFVTAATAYRRKRLTQLESVVPHNISALTHRSPRAASLHNHQLKKLQTSTLTDSRLSNGYSKEDLQRIMRSGGTVHGSSLVLRMLQKENALENITHMNTNDSAVINTEFRTRNQWRRFRTSLQNAERALYRIHDLGKIKEALSLLKGLTDGFSKNLLDDSPKPLQTL